MSIKHELLNPRKSKITEQTEIPFYQMIREVYDLAYDLLCQTIGEDEFNHDIETMKKEGWNAEICDYCIDIEKIADALGIEVARAREDEELRKSIEFSREAFQFEKESNNKPDLDLYRAEELTYIGVVHLMRDVVLGGNNFRGKIICEGYLGEHSVRYTIAIGIAKIYFSGLLEFMSQKPRALSMPPMYISGVNMKESHKEFIEKLFAYALIAPDKYMLALEQKYREDDSTWPIDFTEIMKYFRDSLQIPEYVVVWLYKYWHCYRTAIHMLEEKL